MGHSSEVSCSPTQLKRQGAIILAGLVHISFQKVQGPPVLQGYLGLPWFRSSLEPFAVHS